VYATGEKVNVSPLKIGQHSAEIFNHTSINPEPSFKVDGKKYEIERLKEDKKQLEKVIEERDTNIKSYQDVHQSVSDALIQAQK
ncbi:hypothetical protein IDG69_14905, partial [Staphylococcus sp. EG-SA-23]